MVGLTGAGLAAIPNRGGVVLQDRPAQTEVRVTTNPLQGNQAAIRDGARNSARDAQAVIGGQSALWPGGGGRRIR